VAVEFKAFGIRLDVVPEAMGDGTITLHVDVEVSMPDRASAPVTVGGVPVPALALRRAAGSAQLGSRESLLIRGLVPEADRQMARHTPELSGGSLLERLLISESFANRQAELLVLVTPWRGREPLIRPAPAPEGSPREAAIRKAIEAARRAGVPGPLRSPGSERLVSGLEPAPPEAGPLQEHWIIHEAVPLGIWVHGATAGGGAQR
jgi:pilus assembly protein CpaC